MQGDSDSSPVDDDDLTPEEWAELERLTAPDVAESSQDTEPVAPRTPKAASGSEPAEQGKAEAESGESGLVVDEVEAAADRESGESGSVVGAVEAADSESGESESGDSEIDVVDDDVAYENDTVDQLDDGDAGPAAAPVDELELSPPPEPEPTDEGRPASPAMPLPRVIAVANQKGGVGKTTTTVNVAACLAEQGYRTLLVDLDPQANASTGVGLEPRQLERSIYDVMLHDQPADSVIEPTDVKNLFILPSSLDLAGAEIELVPMLSREHRLRLAIESVLDDYDYVLIDCPPSLGLLTINALTAAREVLVPIQCEYYALEGLGQLMQNIELVRASLNPKLQISHIVLVMFDPRTKLAGQVVDEVRAHFGATVCVNVIPRTVRLSEAPSFGQPITTFDSGSRGAAAYRAVTQEVLGGQA